VGVCETAENGNIAVATKRIEIVIGAYLNSISHASFCKAELRKYFGYKIKKILMQFEESDLEVSLCEKIKLIDYINELEPDNNLTWLTGKRPDESLF